METSSLGIRPGQAHRALDQAAMGEDEAEHQQLIQRSHERSASHGVSREEAADFSPVRSDRLSEMLEKNDALRRYGLPVMQTLFHQIVNTHSMVILSDSDGLLLHALGDNDFLDRARKVALAPGVMWSEQSRGTNAIGTALIEQRPTLVHADEHYVLANRFLTCSAAPITDPTGEVIGVLDVTGDWRSYHKHTMALVRMSACMIENSLLLGTYPQALRLRFHSRPEFIGTLVEGIAVFTADGRFLSANRIAQDFLGIPQSGLRAHTFSSLFGIPVSGLFDAVRSDMNRVMSLVLHNGLRVHARLEAVQGAARSYSPQADLASGSGSSVQGVDRASSVPSSLRSGQFGSVDSGHTTGATAQAMAQARPVSPTPKWSSLSYLDTGDQAISVVLERVKRVLGRDIPILILGETGTGKELLAQAMHHDSPRAAGPFVAVNCASIPDTLIESELFGYEDGAFTGARRKGAIGKIVQAHGGTLFLDEIGDMPLQLQARLLRVLQERVVNPLGSSKLIPVDVHVVCATHRNPKQLIAQGLFREDLYYRLNGLVVRLPALRERSDIDAVVERILLSEPTHGGPRWSVEPRTQALLQRHPWPGNLRQLTNLLRVACVMADEDHLIRADHLPEDFFDDLPSEELDLGTVDAEQDVTSTVSSLNTLDPIALDDIERAAIEQALKACDGNVSAAAKQLGISRNTIYRKLRGQKD